MAEKYRLFLPSARRDVSRRYARVVTPDRAAQGTISKKALQQKVQNDGFPALLVKLAELGGEHPLP